MSASEAASALRRVVATGAALAIPLLISLAGCTTMPSGTTNQPPPPVQNSTAVALEPVPITKLPPAPTNVTPPKPQRSQYVRPQPKPLMVSKGAEKLVAPSAPSLVRASEKTPPSSERTATNRPKAEAPRKATNTPVEALIVKGLPPKPAPPSRMAGKKALLWFGLVLSGGVAAVVVRLYLVRRVSPAELAALGKDDLKMPREMGFKDPINLPQEP